MLHGWITAPLFLSKCCRCTCIVFLFRVFRSICGKNFLSLFAWGVTFFVFVCFQVEESGGQFAAGDRRMK